LAARVAVIVPTVEPALVTPITEAFQSLVLHLLVSHPKLQQSATTW
jgi:D-sedoheptulose 7-phosphate isomerase